MSTVTMVTASGEEHGLLNKLANSSQDNDFKYFDAETKAKCQKQKKEDNRIVKARYINYDGPNERLEKPYCRWAGDPIEVWKFIPGETYTVPKGLVDEVNDPLKVKPKRSGLVGADGKELHSDAKGQRTHEFIILG